MCVVLFFILATFLINEASSGSSCHNVTSLRLVFTVIRHGERTPEYPFYPLDPYAEDNFFFPYGSGIVTNYGIERQYEVGTALRKRYTKFLGNDYYDGAVVAKSTDFKRTKASLVSVLAGLYPPKSINIWSKQYSLATLWQPIPIEVKPLLSDPELLGIVCPRFQRLFGEYKKSEAFMAVNNKYSDLLKYLEKNTGIVPFSDITIIRFDLYHNLYSQRLFGLQLPEWTKGVFPEKLIGPTIDSYLSYAATPDLRKSIAGYLLKEIMEETMKKKSGANRGRKMYIYNCHEVNLATLLISLKVFDNEIPDMSAYISFEVHEVDDNNYAFRVLYQNYQSKDPRVLVIPGCEEFCPFEKFVDIVSDSIPGENEKCTD